MYLTTAIPIVWFLIIVSVMIEQTQIVAAAAANVAAEGLSPRTARIEAEAAASLSMSLAENALVLLMLVEDHLRLESQFFYSTVSASSENGSGLAAPSFSSVPSRRHSAIGIEVRKPNLDASASRRLSITPDTVDTGSLSLEVFLQFCQISICLCFKASCLFLIFLNGHLNYCGIFEKYLLEMYKSNMYIPTG